MAFNLFDYVIIPLLIFTARIFDVSLGTVRIILIAKGYKTFAPVIGFFEVFIWVLAISRVMQNLDNWVCYIAYAGGFAMGNNVGLLIDEKLALGYELVRIITKTEADKLVKVLRDEGYGTTQVKASGSEGEVAVIYVIINRKKQKPVIKLIRKFNPKALYTIEDIRFVNRQLDGWQSSRTYNKHK